MENCVSQNILRNASLCLLFFSAILASFLFLTKRALWLEKLVTLHRGAFNMHSVQVI